MRALLVVAGALSFGVFGIAFAVAALARKARPGRADVIVVLGAKVLPGGFPSGALRARVQRAVQLYRDGYAPKLLFTGGSIDGEPAEAHVAQKLALDDGVPSFACILEAESRTTIENARFTLKLVPQTATLLVVTDPFHLLRARQSFRAEGREVSLAAAPLEGRALSRFDRVYWTVREAFALLLRPRLLVARAPKMLSEVTRGEKT